MSLSREVVLELMALADGELQGEARERAEKLAFESQEARRVLDSMRATELRMWIAEAIGRRAAAADGIANDVMAKLASTSSPRTSKSRSARYSRLVTMSAAAATALAIAAGAVIYVRSGDRRSEAVQVRAGGSPTGGESAQDVMGSRAGGSKRGVEVEEIDSTAHVSIFEISALANASAPSSVVVWIDDEPGEK